MAAKFISERNIRFLLYEVFDIESLTKYDYYKDHNRKVFDMVLKEAMRLAKDLLYPLFEEMDRNPPGLVQGEVKVHPSIRDLMKEFGEGGWISATFPYEHEGEQLPHMLAEICELIFAAANYSTHAYPGLTHGAAHLIESFGSQDLFEIYVPNMLAGKWQGTMALTEPEAGSSLADIVTTAEPTNGDYYLIKEQKTFISAGDHDGVENVIHLMLAKIPGGPPGVKGISLFVVPKKRINQTGNLEFNDVICSGIYHKLGYRGCPIVQLSMGDKKDCRGWLVGEPHRGLAYMFQMMNEARIGVGMGATAMATAAYYASLEYAKTRHQGRKLTDKDPTLPPIPIIQHADVKRILLFQRAVVEGAQSLLTQCSRYVDLMKVSNDIKDKKKYNLLLELLTPIAKSYPSEMGILSVSQGLQCLGGSGYCADYPLEQYYRDCRIHPIHEGTTGIQGIDLLGRKVILEDGQPFALFLDELRHTIERAERYPELKIYIDELNKAIKRLQAVTHHLISISQQKGIELFLADATLYLEFFSIITIAWQWLLQGVAIQKALIEGTRTGDRNFYEGKMFTLRFFYRYELPKILWLSQRLMECDGLTVEMKTDYFKD
ncbi:MAG: acyl-CoA dehydrogenase [Deltaproteobacteria bacterium]|nr:acyl-CoA dehydrogenase [Deltaproteobacteria bacterium]